MKVPNSSPRSILKSYEKDSYRNRKAFVRSVIGRSNHHAWITTTPQGPLEKRYAGTVIEQRVKFIIGPEAFQDLMKTSSALWPLIGSDIAVTKPVSSTPNMAR